jgi:hypothetical protein
VGGRDALAVLQVAPTPTRGRVLSRAKLAAVLGRGVRRRSVEARAAELQATLRTPQLEPSPVLAEASGAAVTALVALRQSPEQRLGVIAVHV